MKLFLALLLVVAASADKSFGDVNKIATPPHFKALRGELSAGTTDATWDAEKGVMKVAGKELTPAAWCARTMATHLFRNKAEGKLKFSWHSNQYFKVCDGNDGKKADTCKSGTLLNIKDKAQHKAAWEVVKGKVIAWNALWAKDGTNYCAECDHEECTDMEPGPRGRALGGKCNDPIDMPLYLCDKGCNK